MMKKRNVVLAICMLVIFSTGCMENNVTVTNIASPSLPPELTVAGTTTSLPATDDSSHLLEGLYIAIAGRDHGSLFLVDVKTGIYQKLEIPGEIGINIYGWSKDICTLIVGTETNRIIQIDVNGSIKKEILQTDELDFNGRMILTTVSLSSDENWLAFISGTGNQEYATYEFQNLIVVSVQGEEYKIYQLTNSGLINGVSWKPDSSALAYNDVDNNGIQQVFISNPDGSERLQLTHFDKEGFVIKSLQWSPTGEKLAFLVSEKEGNTNSLTIVDTSLSNKVTSIGPIAGIKEYWWSPDDVVVANILQTDPNKPAEDALSWYSAMTGEELGKLDSSDLPDVNFALPGPLMLSNQLGFFSHNKFYVCDISSAQLIPTFNQFTDMRYWISAPKAFDKDSCSEK
jgi:WD40 repeat protein